MTGRAEPSVTELAKCVDEATQNIHGYLDPTPCMQARALDRHSGSKLYLKLENKQKTGSFKVRGALNKLIHLGPSYHNNKTLTASTGNHALGYGYALRLLGAEGTVFLPEHASQYKLKQLAAYPLNVKHYGNNCLDTETHARQYAFDAGKAWISPYNDMDIIAGQGSIGVELLKQMPLPDDVLACVGGGGLISGVGAVLKVQGCQIIGCQPAVAADMAKSIEAGHMIDAIDAETLSDGSAGGVAPGSLTFGLCQKLVDRFILVEESDIAMAIRWAWIQYGLRIEGAAGVALGAFLKNKEMFKGKTVCVILCGGNIDEILFRKIIDG